MEAIKAHGNPELFNDDRGPGLGWGGIFREAVKEFGNPALFNGRGFS
jgi:hypothetical protein